MLPDKGIRCPATAFAKSCHSIVTKFKCPKWVNLKGEDPQSGAVIDNYGCVDTFLPMLLIENAKQSRQTGAAVESFRNEMVVANGIAAIQQQIMSAAGSLPWEAPGKQDRLSNGHAAPARLIGNGVQRQADGDEACDENR